MRGFVVSRTVDLLNGAHAFAATLDGAPDGLRRPSQVHGAVVVHADGVGDTDVEADAIVTTRQGVTVGIVTADCIPVLARAESGGVVAIHAGWRGLAAGVIEAGIAALAQAAPGERITAAIGPCAGPCCYEVDAPVLAALDAWHPAALPTAVRPSRPGHDWLDLPKLAEAALERVGVRPAHRATLPESCTVCEPHFESVRRDGAAAGRMLHWIRCETNS